MSSAALYLKQPAETIYGLENKLNCVSQIYGHVSTTTAWYARLAIKWVNSPYYMYSSICDQPIYVYLIQTNEYMYFGKQNLSLGNIVYKHWITIMAFHLDENFFCRAKLEILSFMCVCFMSSSLSSLLFYIHMADKKILGRWRGTLSLRVVIRLVHADIDQTSSVLYI